jgi:hypothetical protein
MSAHIEYMLAGPYVLMASVCENDDRKGRERRDWASPLEHTNSAPIGNGVPSDVVRYDKNDKIRDGEQCNDAGIL